MIYGGDFIRKKVVFPRSKNQKGAVLIFSLIVVSALLILSGAYLSMIISENRLVSRSYNSTVAINLAEAGVERAIWELNYGGGDFLDSEGWSGTDSKTISDTLQTAEGDTIGEYTVTVTDLVGSNPEIEATGYMPNQSSPKGRRSVKVTLEKQTGVSFSMAAFGANGISLDTNTLIDGNIRTDSIAAGGIDVEGTVNGNATAGVDGVPGTVIICSGLGSISGTRSAATSAYNPPSVSPPEGLTPRADITMSGTISSSGQYANIVLGQESTIAIDSDVTLYITTLLHLGKNSQVRITDNVNKVEIYLDGALSFDQGSQINNESMDPSKLTFYGTDSFVDLATPWPEDYEGAFDIDKESEFYGAIYTPNATVQFDRDGQIYGAIVAKYIQLDKNSSIHFDEALLSAGGGSGSGYTVTSWQEK